ncbi:MAG: hypothetical protein E6K79_06145 [Candidatus Eisenbacteria bacterium]|uniref:YncE family protein n=1 Tax=Eiseniibacteriota bacterium TaxID=2212470 RepID=A0A538TMT0_UNCEI|nr:MAG: hypothetical protein E6K79_06145 [Candidatus Eisenbacteria bacterium]
MSRITLCLALSFLCCGMPAAAARDENPLRLVQSVPLAGVEGRIDHMAVDPQGERLFVAALGNGTVEVVDLRSGRRERSLRGFREPQGLGFTNIPTRLFVSNGGDGTCDMVDGATFHHLRTLRFSGDADNIRYDAKANRIYVGYGGGAVGIVDARTGDSLGNVALAGHPESFQLERDGARIFVNIPDASQVAVADRASGQVIATWKLGAYRANYPMELDDPGHRLFVGCRTPAAVVVLDTRSGRTLEAVPVDGDPDDMFYEARRERLYVACGAGFVDVLEPANLGGLRVIARVPTAPGARTALFVPERQRLFVAVPHHASQQSEIRVFDVVP